MTWDTLGFNSFIKSIIRFLNSLTTSIRFVPFFLAQLIIYIVEEEQVWIDYGKALTIRICTFILDIGLKSKPTFFVHATLKVIAGNNNRLLLKWNCQWHLNCVKEKVQFLRGTVINITTITKPRVNSQIIKKQQNCRVPFLGLAKSIYWFPS